MWICVASFGPFLASGVFVSSFCLVVVLFVVWFGVGWLFFPLTVCKLLLHGEKRRKAQLFRHDFGTVVDLLISSLYL